MSPALLSGKKLFAAVLLTALFAFSPRAHAQANPYIEPASKLYQSFEFQNALRSIDKALQWPTNTPQEEVRIALLEGLITAQLGKNDRALSAFKRALALDATAALPFKVSPKVSRLFDSAKKEMVATAPPPPTPPVVKEPPPGPPTPPPMTQAPPGPTVAHAFPPEVRPASAAPPAPRPAETVVDSSPESAARPGALGLRFGASGLTDAVGRSYGSELHVGYGASSWSASLRLRPGPQTGVGAVAAWETAVGLWAVQVGLRADLYLGPMIPAGGVLVGVRYPILESVGITGSGSLEYVRADGTNFRSMASVLSAGVEVRL